MLVIGASLGLGIELAKQYAARQSRILVVGRHAAQLRLASIEIRRAGERGAQEVAFIARDVNKTDEAEEVIQAAWKFFGCVDVVIYNAGESMQACFRSIVRVTPDFDRITQTNYTSVVYILHRVVALFKQQQQSGTYHAVTPTHKPVFALTAGFEAQTGVAQWSLFSAAKHAAAKLVHSVAQERGNEQIQFSVAYPNLMDTQRTRRMILADGTVSGARNDTYALDFDWLDEPLYMQDPAEAAERYVAGLEKGETRIFLNRFDRWAASMRPYSTDIADALSYFALRVPEHEWTKIPRGLNNALSELRCLKQQMKLCGNGGQCTGPVPDMKPIRQLEVSLRKERARMEQGAEQRKASTAKSAEEGKLFE